MEETTASPSSDHTGWSKTLLLATLAVAVILAAFLAFRTWNARELRLTQTGLENLSEVDLETYHGLRVRLVGVTAGGGMIDFRLKVIDPAKARAFLQNPDHLPIVMVAEDGTRMLAADEVDEKIAWEGGEILFMLLGNSGGVVQPGDQVKIEFGDLRLEPIPAR
jgi:hypothetical protein